MNVVIWILSVLILVVVLALLVALFLKKDYALKREIIISRPQKEIFEYIKFLKNQINYNKWTMADPDSKKDYQGTDGEVGFIYSWDSQDKNLGAGSQEITEITDGEKIDYEIRFIRPFKNVAGSYIRLQGVESGSTKVVWGFTGQMPYPMNLMLPVMNMDNLLGSDLAISLQNLKQILEK